LGAEEERILTSFTRRLIEIAAVTSARGPVTPATSLLNSMHLPAIALDRCGFVVDVNAAAAAVFDDDVKVKDKRLFVRDLEARTLLKASPGSGRALIASGKAFIASERAIGSAPILKNASSAGARVIGAAPENLASKSARLCACRIRVNCDA
jgi:hypothetical protein